MSKNWWEETPKEFTDGFSEEVEVHNSNPLLEVANSTIAQCRVDRLSEEKTLQLTIAACIRYAERQGEPVTDELRAAIEVVAKEAMNTEPTMVKCPYCRQWHYTQDVERCPLRS